VLLVAAISQAPRYGWGATRSVAVFLGASASATAPIGTFRKKIDCQPAYTEGIVSLLTDDAWLTMPPQPYEYQGGIAIARFLDDRAARRGANYRLVHTRANGQPAFGCYLPDPQAAVARAYGLMVLTLAEDRVTAITWFGERSLFGRFGLPRSLQM
jgi:hypothetical protein